jgi:acetyl-CoA/propionyl-CoA carboxylase biotin carboxyl carrier protein
VRVDSAAYSGFTITPDYDSMIAKLVVWAPTRAQAIARFRRAIDEYVVEGVPTTLPLLRALCDQPNVIDGTYGTATLEAFAASEFKGTPTAAPSISEQSDERARDVSVEVNDRLYRVRVFGLGVPPAAKGNGATRPAPRPSKAKKNSTASGNDVISPMHGVVVEMKVAQGDTVTEGQVVAIVEAMKMMNEIRAHKAGSVTTVHGSAGATVEAQAALVTIA